MKEQEIIKELTKKNDLKTKWISLIAHDFKGVFSTLAWLLDAYESKTISQEQFLEFLPEIKHNVNQNQRTIHDTLEWVKRQTDYFKPIHETISLQSFLDAILKSYQEEIEKKQLSIMSSIEPNFTVYSDKVMLRFILARTIENALKYSYIGSKITIKAEKNKSVVIEIKDSGIGMNENTIQAIGEIGANSFTGTAGEKGANLSLVIVKEFTEMLNGSMEISSKLEEGTCVTLFFPSAELE